MAGSDTFSKYKALVFDCYGTLIDWETGIYNGLRPLFEKSGKPADRRSIILAFSSVESDLQARHPTMLYSDLLANVYATLDARLHDQEPETQAAGPEHATVLSSAHRATGTTPVATASVGTSSTAAQGGTTGAAEAFARSVETWPPFPDTVAALAALSKRFRLVILSNIDRATIAKTRALLEGPGGFAFDAVITAEEVGAYKPAPEMLDAALARLQKEFGIEQDEVLMTAQSVFHDIVPAKGRGLATAWINREGAHTRMEGVEGDEATFVFPTLGAMAEAVEKASA
ncbi:HAD-like protein [Dichomitus squalens LYAD-421 SS1]|uniref:HAD-like protein n=2 Tax=Dichomitus squalens TaxID=114155 RepID=R7SSA6_DICSQ|nr:HAD-like protein [Dichomitus squalens LYAD-421 SS1]EJF59074.1 HAD-like protein [Dichomitus squalens LYAD-421 SS1]